MESNGTELRLSAAIRDALNALSRAKTYAIDAGRSRWDFAIEVDRVLAMGLSKCELRWLLAKDYIACAREVDPASSGERRFKDLLKPIIDPKTCFILSNYGEQIVNDPQSQAGLMSLAAMPISSGASDNKRVPPAWNPSRRTLMVGNEIVKHYRVPAENQEVILDTFEEDGWPERIDDPLPPISEQDSKRRLQSAIMCLNRNQRRPLIRFRGDGSGTGILWEHAAAPA